MSPPNSQGPQGPQAPQVIVYVEGGGDTRAHQAPLREGFSKLFARVLGGRFRLRVVACGGRSRAFEDFQRGVRLHPDARCILLVDSETAVTTVTKWEHLRQRRGDGWVRPKVVTEADLHFMVEAMETWLLADPDALKTYFAQGFNAKKLSQSIDLESVSKRVIAEKLHQASAPSKRGLYTKSDGFVLIGRIDPAKLRERCRHAAALFDELTRRTA